MDTTQKVHRKVSRAIFRIAEECSRLFKTDVSVQPGNGEMPHGSWVLGIVGIGSIQFTPDATIAAGQIVSAAKGKRSKRRGKRRSDGKRPGRSGGSVGSTGSEASSN